MLAFFCENVDDVENALVELFRAQVGFEKLESRSARIPACCSFEADFVDGTAHAFLNSVEPNFFDALFGIFPFESEFVERGGTCLSPTILLLLQVLWCTSLDFAVFAGSRKIACAVGKAAGFALFCARLGCSPETTC